MPIQTSQTRCDGCKEKKRQQDARELANVKTWQMPTGEWVEMPVAQVSLDQRTVFSCSPIPREEWTIDDPCGPLLDHLIGVAFAQPPYIHPNDARRYAPLIHAFRQFSYPHVPVITIHDSVLTTPSFVKLVQSIILSEFARVGLYPKLKVEPNEHRPAALAA